MACNDAGTHDRCFQMTEFRNVRETNWVNACEICSAAISRYWNLSLCMMSYENVLPIFPNSSVCVCWHGSRQHDFRHNLRVICFCVSDLCSHRIMPPLRITTEHQLKFPLTHVTRLTLTPFTSWRIYRSNQWCIVRETNRTEQNECVARWTRLSAPVE